MQETTAIGAVVERQLSGMAIQSLNDQLWGGC
jgi:hypothetical protein